MRIPFVVSDLIDVLRPIPGALFRDIRTLTLHGAGAREPLKAVLSVLMAVTLADALELDDLSWAAFSGYMVMRADASVATHRGLMRIAGTLSGAAFGVVLAPVIADEPALLVVSLFIATWIGIFGTLKSRYSYAWVFFGITAGLIMTEALAAPDNVLHFAATRAAEITVGTASCILVASLFSASRMEAQTGAQIIANAAREPTPVPKMLSEAWFEAHWVLLEHATRSALAVALLPIIWRWFEIEDFSQTAVTSFVIMVVPDTVIREGRHQAIIERMIHRAAGCLLGSAVALASLSALGNTLLPSLLVLSVGVWVGYHVQNGRNGVSYVGTQFVLGLLITLVQGPGPITDITPGLERLVGILIGIAALCLLIVFWPLKADKQQ
jgi:uncharacterized membrane protein YccC